MIDTDSLKGAVAVFLLRALSLLPLKFLHVLGVLFGTVSYLLNGRSRKVIEENLLHCFPHWTIKQRTALTKKNLQESGKAIFEMAGLWHWPLTKNRQLIRDVLRPELLEEALKKKNGVIILAPHLGNWEVMGIYLAQQGPLTCMYAPSKLAAIDQLMYEGRLHNGTKLAPANAKGVKILLKALKAGEVVGILPDQVPDESGGVFAPFFGKPALTMTLLSALARRTGAAVLNCYAKRREDSCGFDIVLSNAIENVFSEENLTAATGLNQSVEHCVLECPEQYQWEYKRFRERPLGGKKIY